MDNYIVINGKKIELTQEQLETLGVEVKKKDPFARVETGENFYWIDARGIPIHSTEKGYYEGLLEIANYCTDKALMEQRALHETLNRLLWRYSMQHGGEKIKYLGYENRYFIFRDNEGDWRSGAWDGGVEMGCIYFRDINTAESAIEEIVKPFMEQHPEFRW